MTIKYDNYTPKDPSSTGRIFFRDYEDERTDASAGVGVSYPSGIVSVGLSGNEQNVVDGVSSIIPPVVGTASNPSLKLFTPDDIIAFVAAHETGGGGGSITEGALEDLIAGLDASSIQSNDEFLFRVSSGTDELAVTTASGIVTKGLDDLGIDPQSREITTADPTSDDDIDLGYSSLDLWLSTSSGKFYINEVATDGAAIWREFAPSGVTAAEITAGSGTDYRLWTPADVSSAIFQHGGGGGGGVTENLIVRFSDGVNPVNIFQAAGTPKILDDGTTYKYDLSNYTQARLRAYKDDADPGYKFGVRYKTGNPTLTLGDYSAMGDSATEIELVAATAGYHESSWFNLESAAQAEVSFAFVGLDVTSSTNISVHYYEVEFKP